MRETPEFVDAKHRLKKLKLKIAQDGLILLTNKVNKKSVWSLFF